MSVINSSDKKMLENALYTYYCALKKGDLQTLCALMTHDSYLLTLETLGFKEAFKDKYFKKLLKTIEESEESLKEVEKVLSANLIKESRSHQIEVTNCESKGPTRITLNYREDGHPKKLYFSSSHGGWKIDYKAGRPKS